MVISDTRIVHLALSPKAAGVLDSVLEKALRGDWPEGYDLIMTDIRKDIKEQVLKTKKKTTKRS